MQTRDSKITVKGITIPKEILKKKFSPCNLSACKHACCRYGAVIGSVRIKKIKSLLPKLFPMMRPEAVKAALKKGFHLDTLFKRSDMSPEHDHHYMRTVNGRCVFLNYDDLGGCVLQKYCKINKIKYKLKPEGCWAFPFDLVGNRLVVYKWKNLPCLNQTKNKKAPPIYQTCKNELIGFLGQDGYKQLCQRQRKSEEE
ncbi:MAG: DUF3109 family protein [Elusimicrobiota bacterium]